MAAILAFLANAGTGVDAHADAGTDAQASATMPFDESPLAHLRLFHTPEERARLDAGPGVGAASSQAVPPRTAGGDAAGPNPGSKADPKARTGSATRAGGRATVRSINGVRRIEHGVPVRP